MGIVMYEFGNLSFWRDLIFGWCFSVDHCVTWKELRDADIATLEKLMQMSFPAYFPVELLVYISKLLVEKTEMTKVNGLPETSGNGPWIVQQQQTPNVNLLENALTKKEPENEPPPDRRDDRIKLLELILSKAECAMLGGGTAVSADLGYACLYWSTAKTSWHLYDRSNNKPVPSESFETITEAVDRILAKWW